MILKKSIIANNVFHKKGCLFGYYQMQLSPTPISMIETNIKQIWIKMMLELICAEIISWRNLICMSSKWRLLIMASRMSFFCFDVVIRFSSKCQETSRWLQTHSIYINFYADNCYVNLKLYMVKLGDLPTRV